ncbi:MAG: acetyl-CoA carboxylase carboxyltransferase subunit alpha [Ignavibacteria bacterium RIFOXYB2_FULL_35_12]|nr:MAG: acetyl-CoA carboxylase carboxyltransferase subunit alpha [Ignavibacteria bacterium GWA2_36_19]OGU51323.1 MAG: acetyl-CoA carboxylase carboxyltransferase subunit alpha [Ignavibacteria bacterium GWC2_35_8]OGU61430.1 MAG: acetyl-CoA carboxylase carboxyltransferase subunit alpha [Ignavibacteria bacterium GWF2_35_20]OGU78838.1 MAG: acetyl-CoA carboxylase carboxyltransferase subunit alpha [Ignavibacteria bacterium RIFOXYA2_FULL_35_9]OGU85463.1 MAG: acetyl-CoA carboxylase carboxyltransferase s
MAKTVLDFEKPIVELEAKLEEMRKFSDNLDIEKEIVKIEEKVKILKENIYKELTRWQRVQLARHADRPYTLDYINLMTTNFIELHGDRHFKDDKAIVGGFANLDEHKVLIIGHQKGRDTKTNLYRNFGMPNPEGYRKALRLMKLAEKFNKPVITMLDTPGAFPGLEAEERGQAEAIARNLFEMSKLKVPIIVVIIGEGASGGALGLGVGDRILMLENCWYSVISPESCSSILWRSWEYKEQAAEALKLTAPDLLKQKIIDRIIPEPLGGAHKDHQEAAKMLKGVLKEELSQLIKIKPEKLVENRLEKFGSMGEFIE